MRTLEIEESEEEMIHDYKSKKDDEGGELSKTIQTPKPAFSINKIFLIGLCVNIILILNFPPMSA